MEAEKHYLSVQKLIFAKAYSFAKTTGHEVEELISEGNLIYCQALKKHDPKRAKFITLLYLKLDQGLIQYTHKLSKHRTIPEETKRGVEVYTNPTIQRAHHLSHKINSLSAEGKHIVELVLSNPEILFKDKGLKPRQMYSCIKKYIKDILKCPTIKTTQTLAEIKELAYCYN